MNPKDKQIGGSHYKNYKIQPIEFMVENKIPFLEGSVIKYVLRHREKNGIQDIDKAIHYLELLKEIEYI
jgi:UDP-3-O-acyl-N-acetylglucosamine deacetylase